MFKRRKGTAGICGHLYETKLLGLLYYRAIHNDAILEFQLASNVDKIGAFDDICFKAKVKEHDKPVCLFVQAKHKENKFQSLKIDLSTYFSSYLKIRQHFEASDTDLFFSGTFDEIESYFLIYTTAKDELIEDSKVNISLCSNVHSLIDTGGSARHPYRQGEDEQPLELGELVKTLGEIAIKEQMASLAERIADYIMFKKNFDLMLHHELILRYHVILEQKVVDVSEKTPEGHRIATFRQDFFNTNDKYLCVFKDTLYTEIVKRRKANPTDNIKSLLTDFLANTTDAEKLSTLIGPIISYKNGVCKINKQYTEYVTPQQVNEVNVSRETAEQAVERAAKKILLSENLDLKVPAAFGNKDITVRNDKRITHLVTKITDLLDKCKHSKIVSLEESLEEGLLQLNGGIGGAIGTMFVLDDNPEVMKVTSDENSLGTHAKILYQKLNDKIKSINTERTVNKIPDLCEYKFYVKFKQCPKLLLEYSEYEVNLVRDFLNKLLFYSGQADEKGVEDKLKDEIEENLDHNDYLQGKTEQMFFKYHDEIQKWWMLQNEAPYLNRDSRLLKKAVSYITEDPLMSEISDKQMKKIQYNYIFTEDAVRSLNLQDQRLSTIIVAENSVLTAIKVSQHLTLMNDKHVLLDLEYIVSLPIRNRNALRRELINTGKTLIFVCNNIPENGNRTFENVAEAVRKKRTIIITNRLCANTLQKYFGTADDGIVHDDRNSLNDMSEESQMSILLSGRVRFENIEVELEHFVNGWKGIQDLSLYG